MRKRKSPHNEIKLDRILHFVMYSTWFLILLFCLFIFKCTSHASTGDTTSYFPMGQNDNAHFTENDITQISTLLDSENYFIFVRWDAYSGTNNRYKNALFAKYLKSNTHMLCGEVNNNGYQFTLYKSGSLSCSVGAIQCDTRTGAWSIYRTYGDVVPSYFSNMQSSLYSTSTDYFSNYRVYRSNVEGAGVVLKYGWELPPDFMHDTSHATPPDTFESPVYTTGHTPPTNVPPTYTINNYTWTTYTPPTIDTSNAETLLESIYNAIVYNGQYLKDNIHGELTNLVDNIGGFVEYIGDTIQYYGNLIITNIQNGITTFYNNINSAIVGIGNAVGYITQPLDMDNLTNAVNSTHIWGDVGTCTTYANDAFGIYGTVAEPNTFKIPLDLRSISLLNITQVYYIDLSWLDGAKTAIRAFMWCIVTFGLLYSIIVDIPNMIRSSK